MKELNKIINADCMTNMRGIPDKCFDLAIVDPPYGINVAHMSMGSNIKRKGKSQYSGISTANRLRKNRLTSGGGKLKYCALQNFNCDWDKEVPSTDYFSELFRISKNQIICGGNYFSLPPTRGIVVWDKIQPWENFSQCELLWTSFDCPAKLIRLSNTGGKNDLKKIHPTQKPVKLYKWLLNKFANSGDKIIDTHAGSCSSVIACRDLGFEYLAIEKDRLYYEASLNRIIKKDIELKLDI